MNKIASLKLSTLKLAYVTTPIELKIAKNKPMKYFAFVGLKPNSNIWISNKQQID